MTIVKFCPAELSSNSDSTQFESKISECLKKKDYSRALTYINEMLKYDPRCIDCYLGIGILNYYLGNYQEAISFLNRTIEQSNIIDEGEKPDAGLVYIILGIVYDKIGQQEKAKEELSNALKYFENKQDWEVVFIVEAFLKKITQYNNDTSSETSDKR